MLVGVLSGGGHVWSDMETWKLTVKKEDEENDEEEEEEEEEKEEEVRTNDDC